MKRNSQIYIFSLALLALGSCSLTKFVPDGSYLLNEVNIVSEQSEVKPAPFKSYVRQNPNSKWFSLIKVPLYTYNLSGRDSSKWINRMWRRLGDGPVLYDEGLDIRSQQEIKKALNKLSAKEKSAVLYILNKLLNNDTKGLDIKQLKGSANIYRVRKGDIRIIYTVIDGNIRVLTIARRNEKTYKSY